MLDAMNKYFAEGVPHNHALGLSMTALAPGEATMRLPYRHELIGNPDSGVIHGGAITSLMDACCGAAVYARIGKPIAIATLDLRIDYLKPATPGEAVIAHATCYKATRHVAFVRCLAYHDGADRQTDPIAHAAASFMLGGPAGSSKDVGDR